MSVPRCLSVWHAVSQTVGHSVSQSVGQSVRQSVAQSVRHVVWSVSESVSQSVSRSVSQCAARLRYGDNDIITAATPRTRLAIAASAFYQNCYMKIIISRHQRRRGLN